MPNITSSTAMSTIPEFMPVLSKGKHRRPRRGACLMEFVSYLAGERWTDHPAATHRLVGTLARLVNDNTSDAERQQLAPLAPAMIGLVSDDPRWFAVIARRAAVTVLPVAPEHRQRALCVGILICERRLADLDGRPAGTLTDLGRHALEHVPRAWEWAEQFSRRQLSDGHEVSPEAFQTRSAPSIVRTAVVAATEALTGDRDGLLRRMLSTTIDECTSMLGVSVPAPATAQADVTRL